MFARGYGTGIFSMSKILSCATKVAQVLTVLAIPALPAVAAPIVADFSFESPVVSSYKYSPSAMGATFNVQAGVAVAGSPFGQTATDGSQFAFIQSTFNSIGIITLAISSLPAQNSYTITFEIANRPYYESNTLHIGFDGADIGTFTASSTAYTTVTTQSFLATAPTGTLQFSGSATTYFDNDVILDNIRISAGVPTPQPSAVPEPATSAMLLGCSIIGIVWRRRIVRDGSTVVKTFS